MKNTLPARKIMRVWSVVALLTLTVVNVQPLPAQTWKIGLAQVKITPRRSMWMAGYDRPGPANGTLMDLWAKAMVLEAPDGGRAVLVSCDVCGLPRPMIDRIAERLRTRCRLERSRLMFASSHTHCGPVLEEDTIAYPLDATQLALIVEYAGELENSIVDLVVRAGARLVPTSLEAGEGKADFAVNRRNNKESKLEKPLRGPVDHAVPVLAARDPAGSLLAVAFGYACHNTTLGILQWSGDYAGFAQIGLEQRHPAALAMFHMGCGGDQNPLPRTTVELCRQYGARLTAAVDDVLSGTMRPVTPRLRTAFAIVDLPYGRQPTVAELRKIAGAAGPITYRHRWARSLLAQLESGKPLPKSYPYPVQAWKLGDQLWIALGGESVVDYSLLLNKHHGRRTWVTSYANDVMCYVPSHRVWEEGGYEAGGFEACGMPATRWSEDIETRILGAVEQLVRRVVADSSK